MDSSRLQLVIKAIISIIVLLLVAVGEGIIMIKGTPPGINEVILGRILGTLDAAGMIVISYWLGSASDVRALMESVTKVGQTAAATPINIMLPSGEVLKQTTPTQEQAAQSVRAAPTESHM